MIGEYIGVAGMHGASVLRRRMEEGNKLGSARLRHLQTSGTPVARCLPSDFHSWLLLASQEVVTRERHKHCCAEPICLERQSVRQEGFQDSSADLY